MSAMIPIPDNDSGGESPVVAELRTKDESVDQVDSDEEEGSSSGSSSGSDSDSSGDDDSADPSLQRPSKIARSDGKSPDKSGLQSHKDSESEEEENKIVNNSTANRGRYFGLPDISTKCYRCGQVGHIADVCENEELKRPCYLCGKLGHESRDCTSTLCYKCGRIGHKAADCMERQSVKNRKRRTIGEQDMRSIMLCITCGKPGHMFCVDDVVETFKNGPASVTCCQCGMGGHIAWECQTTSRGRIGRVREYCPNCGFGAGHSERFCPKTNRRGSGGRSSYSNSNNRYPTTPHGRNNRNYQGNQRQQNSPYSNQRQQNNPYSNQRQQNHSPHQRHYHVDRRRNDDKRRGDRNSSKGGRDRTSMFGNRGKVRQYADNGSQSYAHRGKKRKKHH